MLFKKKTYYEIGSAERVLLGWFILLFFSMFIFGEVVLFINKNKREEAEEQARKEQFALSAEKTSTLKKVNTGIISKEYKMSPFGNGAIMFTDSITGQSCIGENLLEYYGKHGNRARLVRLDMNCAFSNTKEVYTYVSNEQGSPIKYVFPPLEKVKASKISSNAEPYLVEVFDTFETTFTQKGVLQKVPSQVLREVLVLVH